MNMEVLFGKLMSPLTIISPIDSGVRISTHCLYPSNSTVTVSVRTQMKDDYVVSDDRAAVAEANSSGLQFYGMTSSDIDRRLKPLIKHQGLLIKDGVITSPRVPADAVPAAVLLVANASKEAAEWILGNIKFKLPRDFKKDVTDLLERYFHNNVHHNEELLGHSNKLHRFNHVINLSGQRKLVVDAVTNDAASISSRVVANLDIKMLNNPSLIQRVIYDDSAAWDSSDLKLLAMGAPPLAFSRAGNAIQKLAA